MDVADYFKGIKKIISNGGPTPSDYEFVKSIPDMEGTTLEQEANIYKTLSPILDIKSLLGYTFHKPKGYAGDFELIDRIYRRWISNDDRFKKWDILYHELESSKAVRNRKEYFINEISRLNDTKKGSRVLNLGSGPCTDLYQYLDQTPNNTLKIDCLDMDINAIEYGEAVCDNYYKDITFINKNAFRFKPTIKYDLIWSAGLFDYFSDKLFVRLLNRMYSILNNDGELIIGNFSPANPSRGMMEVFAQWYLHHRNESELKNLAIKAGVKEDKIDVRSESLGVNLFLHLKK